MKMIDFVRFSVPQETASTFLNCNDLNFHSTLSHQTGEVETSCLTASFPEGKKHPLLTFKIRGNYVEVAGSLHKYWHKGKNYTDYTYPELLETIESLKNKFGIKPETAIIHNLEIGVNMTLSFCKASEFLDNCFLHSNKTFSLELFSGKGKLKRFSHQRYEVKVYDKGIQYLIDKDLLRFEKKYRRMRDLGLVTLHDLTKPHFLEKAINALQDVASGLVVSEPHIKKTTLSKPKKRLVIDWENPIYLRDLAKNNPRKFRYEREKYKNIVKQFCKKSIYQDFENKLHSYLANYQNEIKTCTFLTENTRKKRVLI
jgi:hypothetical protein